MIKLLPLIAITAILVIAIMQTMVAQETGDDPKTEDQNGQEDGKALLRALVGKWEGSCRTWFKPGNLGDMSKIKGEIQPILEGRFFRHQYASSIREKPRKGEETLAFNAVTKEFQSSWIDDFHMSYAIMFSKGKSMEKGFVVIGSYDVAPDGPPWNWKTVYELVDADHLTITSYNVMPEGEEAKAVEVKYARIKE